MKEHWKNPEDRIVQFGDMYIRFDDIGITFGKYNEGDIETLGFWEMKILLKFITHKISKILIKIK